MPIKIRRIYEKAIKDDSIRILVDRLWPRGISKDNAKLDHWLKNIGPSTELRKSFHNNQMEFAEFEERYLEELKQGEQYESLEKLKEIVKEHPNVTLLQRRMKKIIKLFFWMKDER